MSLLDDLNQKIEDSGKPARCVLGQILDGIPHVDTATALETSISKVREDSALPVAHRFFTIKWLTDVLNDNGYQIGKTAVGDHIRKKCACERQAD